MKETLRKKISRATREAMKNPLIREKMRIAKLGKTGNRKGYKCTEEQIQQMRESHKGQKAWNKGLKGCYKQSKETIAKRVSKMMESNNPSWKGDKVGYGGVHEWIRNKYGKAIHCENKKCPGKSEVFEWANISGNYKRDRKDFLSLCRSCHRRFDKGTLLLIIKK